MSPADGYLRELADILSTVPRPAAARVVAAVPAEQLRNLVHEKDLVLAISGSGNSPNVLRAVGLAEEAGAVTVGLSGFTGGPLAGSVQIPVVVPCSCVEQIEDVHLALCHAVAFAARRELRSPVENLFGS